MKKIILSLTLILFLIPHLLIGQPGWIKDFSGPGEDRGSDIIHTQDDNYLFAINSSQGFGSGLDEGSYLFKIDIDGNILWTNKYSTDLIFSRVIETHDNGFLIYTKGNGIDEPILIKTDEDGNEEWSMAYQFEPSNPTDKSRISQIITTLDGNFLITGNQGLVQNGLLRKVDQDFNEIWTNMDVLYTYARMAETPQEEIGITSAYTVLKLDADGNTIWSVLSPPTDFVNPQEIFSHPAGGFTLFYNFFPLDSKLQARLDDDGNLVYLKELAPVNQPMALSYSVQVSDGYITTGTGQNLLPDGGSIIPLIKSDFEGNQIWQRNINHITGTAHEYTGGIAATPDDGVIGIANHGFTGTVEDVYVFKTNHLGYIHPNKIIGKIAIDEQPNCQLDSNEMELAYWYVSAENATGTYYASSDFLGNYCLSLDSGEYTLSVHPPNNLWMSCEDSIQVMVDSNSILTNNFPIEPSIDCPLLVVSGTLIRARPCFDNNRYHVQYHNEGTTSATDAYIEVTLDDDLSYVSSSIPLTAQNGNVLTFDIGDVPISGIGDFYLDYLIDCSVVLGQSICIESHIYPDSLCTPISPLWNGAFVEVEIVCDNSDVTFYLKNTGTADMLDVQQYSVVEDAILLMMNNFQLLQGQIDSISIPSNGATYAMMADQVMNAPGSPLQTVVVEGCGTNGNGFFSLGFMNQFSLGNSNPFIDLDCRETSLAYDPNDKQGFPIGYSNEHYIRPNQEIEYLIRFQNTGTDTAFNVVVKDEISALLDLPSIQIGASSHPMEWKISDGNTLEFTFNNIMLPDSNINEAASHGFVEFKISQKPDLPDGTVIKNDAGIYFDFNDPIITNETFHTIGLEFITVSTQNPISNESKILVRPNPFQHQAIFELENIETTNGLFELFDISGRLAWQQKFSGKLFELKRNDLKSGMYFYKISDNGKAINSGKIIVN